MAPPLSVDLRKRDLPEDLARLEAFFGEGLILPTPAERAAWFDRAVEWIDKNQPRNPELLRFRAEAAALPGVSPAAERLRLSAG